MDYFYNNLNGLIEKPVCTSQMLAQLEAFIARDILNQFREGDSRMCPTENAELKTACQKMRITTEDCEKAIRDYLTHEINDAEDVLYASAHIIIQLFRLNKDMFDEVKLEILKRMVKTDFEIV